MANKGLTMNTKIKEIEIGDIFKSSWGDVEKAGVEYFQVVAKPTENQIVVKEIYFKIVRRANKKMVLMMWQVGLLLLLVILNMKMMKKHMK